MTALTSLPDAITVFCGASLGNDPTYSTVATNLGQSIADEGWTLVYGGGTSGLMGVVSEACLDRGGRVHGVIPSAFLSRPASSIPTTTHDGPTTPSSRHPPIPADTKEAKEAKHVQSVVENMHVRKKKMADLSRGFLVLPGGYGSLEELAEMTTWTQLGIHKKPVILININDFFSPLRSFIEGAIKAGFIQPSARAFLTFLDAPSSSAGAGDWDWGKEAISAVKEWEQKDGAGGAKQFSLEWQTRANGDLR